MVQAAGRGSGSKRCRSAMAGSVRWSLAATAKERLQLNEDSLWLGWPDDDRQSGRARGLAEDSRAVVRRQIRRGPKAHEPHANLPARRGRFVRLVHDARRPRRRIPRPRRRPTDYRRELSLDDAIVRVRYRVGDAQFVRETFSSYPDQVLVSRITCDRPGGVNLKVRLSRSEGGDDGAGRRSARDVRASSIAATSRRA